jgi:hypothetical protein
MKEALLQKQYNLALSGNRVALKNSLDQIAKAEQNKRELVLEFYEACLDYKENYQANAKFWRDRALGPLLPRPDDIQLNPYTAKVTVTGPRTEDELVRLKQILEAREFILPALDGLRKDFEECRLAGFPRSSGEGEILTRLENLLHSCDSELEGQGWLPRVAAAKERKAN